MQAFVITARGAEKIGAIEVKELIQQQIVLEDTVVKFSINSLKDLCTICYRAQSISRAVLLLTEFSVHKSLDITMKNLIIQIPREFLKKFSIECRRTGEHDFKSVDLSASVAGLIISYAKNYHNIDLNTDYETPLVCFYLYVNGNKGYFGVDFAGFDLSKRQYKIFNHPESLRGTTGYALVRLSDYNKKHSLLDPFMGSGIIVIEAALFSLGLPVHYYDKDKLAFTKYEFFRELPDFFNKHDSIRRTKTKIYGFDSQFRYLQASQKNAKLAGLGKEISLSKCEIEWLDTKLEKKSIDLIVSDPPRISRQKDLKILSKLYNELFYQADYILKKTGKIFLLCKEFELLKEAAQKHRFILKEKYSIFQGEDIFNVLVFKRV
jgi:23S rRNA G2445 N2-methylase RlmL